MSSQFTPFVEGADILDLHDTFPSPGQKTTVQRLLTVEDGWRNRDPHRVLLAYTADSYWRKRSEAGSDRQEIVGFLIGKWLKDLGGQLVKEFWAWSGTKITARFAYERYDRAGEGFRSRKNADWEFDADSLTERRSASINDFPIGEADQSKRWDRSGPRFADHSGLSILEP
jgi:nuclear transport factor 2 (NTF2) superfamily protein